MSWPSDTQMLLMLGWEAQPPPPPPPPPEYYSTLGVLVGTIVKMVLDVEAKACKSRILSETDFCRETNYPQAVPEIVTYMPLPGTGYFHTIYAIPVVNIFDAWIQFMQFILVTMVFALLINVVHLALRLCLSSLRKHTAQKPKIIVASSNPELIRISLRIKRSDLYTVFKDNYVEFICGAVGAPCSPGPIEATDAQVGSNAAAGHDLDNEPKLASEHTDTPLHAFSSSTSTFHSATIVVPSPTSSSSTLEDTDLPETPKQFESCVPPSIPVTPFSEDAEHLVTLDLGDDTPGPSTVAPPTLNSCLDVDYLPSRSNTPSALSAHLSQYSPLSSLSGISEVNSAEEHSMTSSHSRSSSFLNDDDGVLVNDLSPGTLAVISRCTIEPDHDDVETLPEQSSIVEDDLQRGDGPVHSIAQTLTSTPEGSASERSALEVETLPESLSEDQRAADTFFDEEHTISDRGDVETLPELRSITDQGSILLSTGEDTDDFEPLGSSYGTFQPNLRATRPRKRPGHSRNEIVLWKATAALQHSEALPEPAMTLAEELMLAEATIVPKDEPTEPIISFTPSSFMEVAPPRNNTSNYNSATPSQHPSSFKFTEQLTVGFESSPPATEVTLNDANSVLANARRELELAELALADVKAKLAADGTGCNWALEIAGENAEKSVVAAREALADAEMHTSSSSEPPHKRNRRHKRGRGKKIEQ